MWSGKMSTATQTKKWWSLLLHNLVWILIIQSQLVESKEGKQVKLVYAINAGGGDHVDVHGIRYMKDPATVGTESDYGNRLSTIRRCYPQDETLYRTERYHSSTFGYDIPINADGDYVLVLKFAEVYFQQPGQKVFDVELNQEHTVVTDLDIFAVTGLGMAHDEIIPFSVSGQQKNLKINGEESKIRKKSIRVNFVKGPYDNPKICAFYVIMGTVNDIPQLPPPSTEQGDLDLDEFDDEEEYDMNLEGIPQTQDNKRQSAGGKRRFERSGSTVRDPWESEGSFMSLLIPMIIAVVIGLVLIYSTVKYFRGV